MSSCRASSSAFLLTGAVAAMPMLLGAAGAAAVVAVVLIELVKRVGQVEPGAAMGVVFTTLFAMGVLLWNSRIRRRCISTWNTR
jgi:ABC-type Mn2+/Zn2+ transport system permease subunit